MKKAQSILEYLFVLIMAVLAVTGGSFIFNRGVESGLDESEDYVEGVLPTSVDDSYQGPEVGYNPGTDNLTAILPSDISTTRQGTVVSYDPEDLGITIPNPEDYEGRPYFEDKQLGEYYYHEGPSDMSGVPANGAIVAQSQGTTLAQVPTMQQDPRSVPNPYPFFDRLPLERWLEIWERILR